MSFYFFTSGHTEHVLLETAHAEMIAGGKIDRETTAMIRVVFIGQILIHVNGR